MSSLEQLPLHAASTRKAIPDNEAIDILGVKPYKTFKNNHTRENETRDSNPSNIATVLARK